MQLLYTIPALFAASTFAATFNGFVDTACQQHNGAYITVTAAQLKDLVVQEYPITAAIPEASRAFASPADRARCPSNSDDTYKYISVPQWSQGNIYGPNAGGAVSVVYYEETDTYNMCRYSAAAQPNGYIGFCK